MRLIDATTIEQYILNNCSDNEEINAIYAEIINAPSVEAEPIRHGHWIYKEHGYPLALGFYTCSVCGSVRGLDIDNYCPNCGAKMDEDWEEPEINPCRGCADYDGQGGCKSNGGCGAKTGYDFGC